MTPKEASSEKKPSYYNETWERLAWCYDAIVKFFLLPLGGERRLRNKFLDFANLRKGEQVLDICSGTASFTALIASRVGTEGKVTGVDLSDTMLKIARKRAPSITFQQANSENLPFSASAFDSVFLSFCLHEMPESARINALKEAYRVLKPGGNLFILDYNLARNRLARFAVKTFVRIVEPESAYQMLLNNSLPSEIEKAGFTLKNHKVASGGTVQMIQAHKGKSNGLGD